MKAAVRFPIILGDDAREALTKYLEGKQEAHTKRHTLPMWWEEQRSHACSFLHALMRENPGLKDLESFRTTLATAEQLKGWQPE